MLIARILLVLFILVPGSVFAENTDAAAIPEQLQPWKEWVLHGYENQLSCTPSMDNSARLQCDWPTRLDLELDNTGGTFAQTWLIQHEKWVVLPGDQNNWPGDVTINDNRALVIERGGLPHVRLQPGTYSVHGSFTWFVTPEYLTVPPQSGLISLSFNGKIIDFPVLDRQGRLWLQAKKTGEETIENRLKIESYRFIHDSIPMMIDAYLHLDVSGLAREVLLGPVFDMDTIVPVSLNSPLPARIEPDGRLRIQLRPGQWNIIISARHLNPVASLSFSRPEDDYWPREEIWVFNAHPNLRLVEIENVPAIDPLQTSLPVQWQKYPAYRILEGDVMQFKEIKRGDPVPAPDQLQLNRRFWLRFDGTGYTLQDTVTGTKNTNWRLEMNPPIKLGRVSVDGQEQFITSREGTDKTGVELRKGILNLVADSEYFGNISTFPATGWDHDFQQVRANLFLPPGWRLLNASGMDSVHGTWVKRWTLLDFFIVLILTLAIARLFSKPMAALAFVSLVLMYHEPNAPKWIWIAILICVALLRYLPEGKFKKIITAFQAVNVVILIVIAIPFSIEQLRLGIFPQLEKPWHTMTSFSPVAQPDQTLPQSQYEEAAARLDVSPEIQGTKKLAGRLEERAKSARPLSKEYGSSYDSVSSRDQVAQYDPSMINQTGPGLPTWQWNSIPLNWSGPVRHDQQISLLLLGPRTNLVLSFVRVTLLVLLTLGIFRIRRQLNKTKIFNRLSSVLLPFLFGCLLLFPSMSEAGQIPSPEMLDELRSRLLEKADCFPECADMSRMNIDIHADFLQLQLHVAAQTSVYIPLPGNANHWLPQEVTVDNKKAEALFRTNNQLWLLVQKGDHEIVLKGRIPTQNSLQLPLPLKPHRVVQSRTEGWTVEGIKENGRPDNQIQFRRIVQEESITHQILDTGILPPFLTIERTLQLGLNWTIETVVRRSSPDGSAVVFEYPLLSGESVLTDGLRVKDKKVQITLDPQQTILQWESVLEKTGHIGLKHAETDLWTEIWKVDISPIFHMETSGIPVILRQQGKRWYPTWHPWPGEEVTLLITRPAGVEGQTITIDKVHVENQPGQRSGNTQLTLNLRSSQGGQHTVILPDDAQLMEVRIDGKVLPIRQKDQKVTLPVNPGKQEIRLYWSEAGGMDMIHRTPEIDIGQSSVNTNIDLKLPQDRWPLLLGGPLMGPAILFWSVVLIILLVAFGLAKTNLTPLKFHQWFLLGIGMSQSSMIAALFVVGWLIALEFRRRVKPEMEKTTFNLMQIGIAALTVIAIGSLIMAISQGLLGHPDMNIVGNGSSSSMLKWYQDHSSNVIPRAWVLSIPMLYYRLAMLAWALWISFSLINLLKWGWNNYTEPVIWHKIPRKAKKKTARKNEAESTETM